jgi:hypothetical protein
MQIYEPDAEWPSAELSKLVGSLRKNLPGIRFEDHINYYNGKITGYTSSFNRPDLVVYYVHNIAVLRFGMSDLDLTAQRLLDMGFSVSEQLISYPISRLNRHAENPDTILWDELRRPERIGGLVKRRLEELLGPIFDGLKGKKVEEYEFAVYNPSVVTSTDDVRPPYMQVDETFRLPCLADGRVELGRLLAKIKLLSCGRAIGISSRVKVAGEEQHIQMIDFSSRDGIYQQDVEEGLQRLGQPSKLIVESSSHPKPSFHYYNLQTLLRGDRNTFFNYLGGLEREKTIGKGWPRLQGNQGFAMLRITPSADKSSFPQPVKLKG